MSPPRPGIPLITLRDGLLVERDGRSVVHVDVAAGDIILHLPGQASLSFGLSVGGLDDASRTMAVVVRRAIGQRRWTVGAAAPRQGQLFGADVGDIDLVAAADDAPDGELARWWAGAATGVDDARSGGRRALRRDRLQALLRDAILERCRAVARRREARVDEVAARVHPIVDTPLVYGAAVLETPWLVDDVLRFRAAAIAVAMAETLPPPVRAAAGVRALIPLLSRWRSLFARDGQPTGALRRSLALLDDAAFAGVDAHDVWRLRHVTLVQSLRSPRHLRLLAERVELGGPGLERDLRLLQLADDDVLDDALDDVARALRLRSRGSRQHEHVLAEVLSQAEGRPGDERLGAPGVRTLVRRRLEAMRAARRRLTSIAGGAPVAVAPPIPLPEDGRLRFLATEADFLAEGQRMHHCVGTYFHVAAGGAGWFFHYEDEDGPATVRVGRTGVVVEARGPCNTATAPARRAAALLTQWGVPLTVLGLADPDAPLWHGAGPGLVDDDRPLRTLEALAGAAALEIAAGHVRDVFVYGDMLRALAERALRGEAWLFFDPAAHRIRAHHVDTDGVSSSPDA